MSNKILDDAMRNLLYPADVDCQYCEVINTERPETCGNAHHMNGVFCTRPNGHEGKHVACGVRAHNIHEWE